LAAQSSDTKWGSFDSSGQLSLHADGFVTVQAQHSPMPRGMR